MKNVTLTLPDDVLARARIEAAKEGKSLSRFVSDLVERRIGRKKTQSEALAAFLAGPSLHLLDENGKAPSRAELYDDAILRGHQRPDLQPGPPGHEEAKVGDDVAD